MISFEAKKQLRKILSDDLSRADVSSNVVPVKGIKARIVAKELCVVAGLEEAQHIFGLKHVRASKKKRSGEKVRANSAVLILSGSNHGIFNVERTALNVISRMSAVATACAEAKKIAGKRVKVALTRKTMPGFNLFDNRAAEIAGVWTHRINLNSFVLLKDNHLASFENPSDAVLKAREVYGNAMKVEIEVDSLQQAFDAITAKPEILMLDNFSPASAKSAIKKLRSKGFKGKVELSGGITLKNLKAFAKAKPDIISMGSLTQSVASKNFSLEVL